MSSETESTARDFSEKKYALWDSRSRELIASSDTMTGLIISWISSRRAPSGYELISHRSRGELGAYRASAENIASCRTIVEAALKESNRGMKAVDLIPTKHIKRVRKLLGKENPDLLKRRKTGRTRGGLTLYGAFTLGSLKGAW